jgi:hypothetical protein
MGKIGAENKRNVGKYCFVNGTIQLWSHLIADALGALSYKPSGFKKKMVRKVTH